MHQRHMRAYVVGFALLATGGVLVLDPGLHGGQADEPTPCCAAGGTPVWVCPLYSYANHGEYCSYYAEHCKGVWGPLDTTCGLNGSCFNPQGSGCVDVSDGESKEKKADKAKKVPHAVDPKFTSGLEKKKAPKLNAVPAANKHFITQIGNPILAKLETHPEMNKSAKVALYLMLIEPAKHGNKTQPPLILSSGLEVAPNEDEPLLDLKYADVVKKASGQVCTIELGGVSYQVILHKDTVLKPK